MYAEAFQQDFSVFMSELEKVRVQTHQMRTVSMASPLFSHGISSSASNDVTVTSAGFKSGMRDALSGEEPKVPK